MSAKKGPNKNPGTGRNAPDPARLEKDRLEKRQTAYLFSCAGGILWVVPAASSLVIGIVSDGMSPGVILAFAVLALGIPNSLFAINAYKKKSGRKTVIALDCALAVLHAAALYFIGTWYVILSPALILLFVMMATSDVIENH